MVCDNSLLACSLCYKTGGSCGAPTCAAASQTGYAISGCNSNTAVGSSCTATCASGYSTPTGGSVTGTMACQASGAYSGAFAGCYRQERETQARGAVQVQVQVQVQVHEHTAGQARPGQQLPESSLCAVFLLSIV